MFSITKIKGYLKALFHTKLLYLTYLLPTFSQMSHRQLHFITFYTFFLNQVIIFLQLFALTQRDDEL